MKEHYTDKNKHILELISTGGTSPEIQFSVIMGQPSLPPVEIRRLIAMLCTWLAVEAPHLMTPDLRSLSTGPAMMPDDVSYGGWYQMRADGILCQFMCPECSVGHDGQPCYVKGDVVCAGCARTAARVAGVA